MGIGGALHGSALGGALHGTGIHKFDTGLFKAQRTTIREAIVARLGELLKVNGRYIRAIVEMPRALRGEADQEGIDILHHLLQGQAPAIAIALGRKTYEATDSDAYICIGDLSLTVFVASQHGRDLEKLVEGRLAIDVVAAGNIEADPGIEAMLEHVEELLLGQDIAVQGVNELRPVEEDEVATFEDLTVWQQTYSIEVERQIKPARRAPRLVTSLQGDHKVDGIDEDSPLSPVVTTIAELEA